LHLAKRWKNPGQTQKKYRQKRGVLGFIHRKLEMIGKINLQWEEIKVKKKVPFMTKGDYKPTI
jgi:hypothetical protein